MAAQPGPGATSAVPENASDLRLWLGEPLSDYPQRVPMFQVRLHGRGGQGVVTAAEMLSVAAFIEGRYAQAFPSFGSERTGAPVVAFCRIDDREIRSREPIQKPDAIIVLDPTLLQHVDMFAGMDQEGYVLLNSSRSFADLGVADVTSRFKASRALTVPATDLAREHLGRPLPNAVLLGGFAALTGVVSIESVLAAIRGRFSGKVADGNAAAAAAAYAFVQKELGAAAHA